MLDIDITRCSACTACIHLCPTDAIIQVKNENGFLLPYIDEDICIDCGICDEVCDFIKDKITKRNIQKAYSLVINNKEDLYNSTSGGAFTALSDIILDKRGYIVGAIMDDNFDVKHIITNTKAGRDSMRGSKYVQSDMGDILFKMEKLLKADNYVMYVGTPCQTAGVLSYFDKKPPKLIVVDFLCHGVPNNDLFKAHIDFVQQNYNKKIKGYTFRDKKHTWNPTSPQGIKIDGKFKYPFKNQSFFTPFFASNYALRDACFNCKYRSYYRYSDITIADFWAIERFTGKKDKKGVSLVLANSDKGEELMVMTEQAATVKEYPVEDILFRVSTTPVKAMNREEFWELYHSEGYQALYDKYVDQSAYKKIRFAVKKIVKRQR